MIYFSGAIAEMEAFDGNISSILPHKLDPARMEHCAVAVRSVSSRVFCKKVNSFRENFAFRSLAKNTKFRFNLFCEKFLKILCN